MDKAALLGHPVKHTLSPQIFTALGRLLEREIKYKAIDVDAAKLGDVVERLKKEEYAGANVTLPH